MNAFEFVKKYGLNRATEILQYMPEGAASFDFINIEYSVGMRFVGKKHIRLDLVKRIVDSHEIVESHKFPEDDETGLDGAHCLLDMYGGYELVGEKLERLKQAIADVESCQ